MKEFYIGEVDPFTFPKLVSSPEAAVSKANDSGYFSSKILLNFLPLLIIGLAILLFFYPKKE